MVINLSLRDGLSLSVIERFLHNYCCMTFNKEVSLVNNLNYVYLPIINVHWFARIIINMHEIIHTTYKLYRKFFILINNILKFYN